MTGHSKYYRLCSCGKMLGGAIARRNHRNKGHTFKYTKIKVEK